MTHKNIIPCPISSASYSDGKGCATMLQRSPEGDLIDGVRLHLLTVHNWHGPRAAAVARTWVRAQP